MQDIAPGIFRQRLLIEGIYAIDVEEETIHQFFTKLVQELRVTASGPAIVNSSLGKGSPENQGIEAFIPLIESGVALYTWRSAQFLSLIIYTCKAFDEKRALTTVRDFFQLSEMDWKTF